VPLRRVFLDEAIDYSLFSDAAAQFPAGFGEIVSETVRLRRKHHLGYDQTKYVVEQARRRLKLQPVGTRRRTVNRLYKSEVDD
jgi:hypothetical protein